MWEETVRLGEKSFPLCSSISVVYVLFKLFPIKRLGHCLQLVNNTATFRQKQCAVFPALMDRPELQNHRPATSSNLLFTILTEVRARVHAHTSFLLVHTP